ILDLDPSELYYKIFRGRPMNVREHHKAMIIVFFSMNVREHHNVMIIVFFSMNVREHHNVMIIVFFSMTVPEHHKHECWFNVWSDPAKRTPNLCFVIKAHRPVFAEPLQVPKAVFEDSVRLRIVTSCSLTLYEGARSAVAYVPE
ncbi:hypothetical protein L9F63_009226, partial [Diploptera punctata]